jgi:hypothetical protein
MEVIEVGVGNEHQVNCRQIPELDSRLAQSFQYKQPAGKIWVDDDVFAAHLQKKTGMANEGNSHMTIAHQHRLVRLSASGCDGRAPHQLAELAGALTHCRTFDGLSKHKKLLAFLD